MSIRYKIAFLFAGLVCFILLCLCSAIYIISVEERDSLFYTRLKNRAIGTANTVTVIADSSYRVLGTLDTTSVASLQNKSITVLNYNGETVYSYADDPGNKIVLTPEIIEETKFKTTYFFSLRNREAVAIHLVDDNHNFIVAVAAEDVDGKTFLNGLKKLLTWVFVIAVIVSFITGYVFAKILLRPLSRMIAEVKLVSSNNLSRRINTGNNNDELQQLGKTFNELLDKMQESFTIQRRFISNASHELSTPLTSVSSQLEVALHKERNATEYKQVIQSVYEDVKDLQQLTRSLLDIAKSGSQGSLELNEVRIDEVLMKVASDVQKLRSEYTVHLFFETLPEDEQLLTVFGNVNLLYIAFKNIVENGCKYSDNHTADINVSFGNSFIIVAVKSIGDVIAEADIQNVFQPFFRTETVRHKQGSGLGLALTKRILSLHKSSIEVSSSQKEGTLFLVTLPYTHPQFK